MSEKIELQEFRESLESFQRFIGKGGKLDEFVSSISSKLEANRLNRVKLETLLEACASDEVESNILNELSRINCSSINWSKKLIELHSILSLITTVHGQVGVDIFSTIKRKFDATVGLAHDELASSACSEGFDDDALVMGNAVGHAVESMLEPPVAETNPQGPSVGSSSTGPIIEEVETDEEQDVHK